jgi:peptidyl-prolyl cis-trans isomerase A (cyclophilin A)
MIAAMAALALTAGCSNDAPTDDPAARPAGAAKENPIVVIETSMGTIKAELWINKAPITVANFLRYVDEEFYDNLIFHRVMKGFMIQGGGMYEKMDKKRGHAPIKNEASSDKRNDRGTLAMARTGVIDSATSEFFINLKDNEFLNHGVRDFGYCAFGKVIEGMDVVDKIAAVPVADVGGHEKVPVKPVFIKSIRRAK